MHSVKVYLKGDYSAKDGYEKKKMEGLEMPKDGDKGRNKYESLFGLQMKIKVNGCRYIEVHDLDEELMGIETSLIRIYKTGVISRVEFHGVIVLHGCHRQDLLEYKSAVVLLRKELLDSHTNVATQVRCKIKAFDLGDVFEVLSQLMFGRGFNQPQPLIVESEGKKLGPADTKMIDH